MPSNPAASPPGDGLETRAARLLADITDPPWAWEWIAEKSNEWAVGQAWTADGTRLSGHITDHDDMVDTVIERRLVGMDESGNARAADAEFIAAAPDLVRDLLASLTSATRRLQQVEGLVAEWEAEAQLRRSALLVNLIRSFVTRLKRALTASPPGQEAP